MNKWLTGHHRPAPTARVVKDGIWAGRFKGAARQRHEQGASDAF
jgi:hypothetical protein